MTTAAELPIVVQDDETGEGFLISAPNGTPHLNNKGVEIANIMRKEGDREFIFAQPILIRGIDRDSRLIIQVGGHTLLYIDQEGDDYFL